MALAGFLWADLDACGAAGRGAAGVAVAAGREGGATGAEDEAAADTGRAVAAETAGLEAGGPYQVRTKQNKQTDTIVGQVKSKPAPSPTAAGHTRVPNSGRAVRRVTLSVASMENTRGCFKMKSLSAPYVGLNFLFHGCLVMAWSPSPMADSCKTLR